MDAIVIRHIYMLCVEVDVTQHLRCGQVVSSVTVVTEMLC